MAGNTKRTVVETPMLPDFTIWDHRMGLLNIYGVTRDVRFNFWLHINAHPDLFGVDDKREMISMFITDEIDLLRESLATYMLLVAEMVSEAAD